MATAGYQRVPASAVSPARLLRPEEAAASLGLSRTEVFALIKSGEVESIKIGQRRRVVASSLDDYIARKLAEQTQQKAS